MSKILLDIAKEQLARAKRTVAAGEKWRPELILFRGGAGVGVWVKGDDPMGRASEIVREEKPDGYVFMTEGWMSFPTMQSLRQYQQGDFSEAFDKMEIMMQIAAEDGQQFSNLFTIDRINGVLESYEKQERIRGEAPDDRQLYFRSRMPAQW